MYAIAIDGPSGTGKGTVAKKLAKKLNLVYIDTGATYRCVALEALNKNVSTDNIEGIKKIVEEIKIDLKNPNLQGFLLGSKINLRDGSSELLFNNFEILGFDKSI